MSQLNKATFETTYQNTSGTFADNTTRQISEGDLRQFADDIADSFTNKTDDVKSAATGVQQLTADYLVPSLYATGTFVKHVAITAASMLTGNSVPITIVDAPGAGYVLVPVMFFVHLDWNTDPYVGNTGFRFEINDVAVTASNTTIMPGTADRFTTMLPIAYDTTTDLKNKAITLQVQLGDPSDGDSPIFVSCIYRVVPTTALA